MLTLPYVNISDFGLKKHANDTANVCILIKKYYLGRVAFIARF